MIQQEQTLKFDSSYIKRLARELLAGPPCLQGAKYPQIMIQQEQTLKFDSSYIKRLARELLAGPPCLQGAKYPQIMIEGLPY